VKKKPAVKVHSEPLPRGVGPHPNAKILKALKVDEWVHVTDAIAKTQQIAHWLGMSRNKSPLKFLTRKGKYKGKTGLFVQRIA
jgi:hypothetical protein